MKALLLLGLVAAASTGEDEFYAGMNLDRQGKHREAAAHLVALADRAPQDPFADDALIEAARLHDQKLGEPGRAAELYERIVREYPSSRLALRARRRAEELRAGMGTGGKDAATLTEFNEILYGFAGRPRAESKQRLVTLLAEHPDFPLAPRATHWLGTLHQQDGEHGQALARFRETQERWPESEWAHKARRGEGDVLMARHDWAGARRAYESLRGRGDPGLERTADEALAALAKAKTYADAATGCWALLLLLTLALVAGARHAAGSFRAAGKALARPPTEFFYLLPMAALFVIAALTEHEAIGGSVTMIAVGALVVTWLSGAALQGYAETRAPRLLRVLAHIVGTTAAVMALSFIAIYEHDLIELVLETAKHGTE